LPSLEAVNLSKSYGSFKALSALNLKLEGSKCVGYLGPNGSGKTTTLKLFTDMIRASEGKALINGISVHENKRMALEHCGALIESPEIYPSFTPREALSMIAEIRGIPSADRKKRIEDAISEVKMDEWLDKKVGKFSKGMKQRVNVASALLSEPDIVLLDEPSTGLDPRGMAEVRDIVKSLKQNRLVFMSSHLLSEVSEVCDEVAIIDHGELIVYDTIENVTAKWSGDGVQELVEVGLSKTVDDSILTGRVAALQNVASVEKIDSRHFHVWFPNGDGNQEKLLADLVALKIGVISFRPSTSALEDSYLKLIKDTM